MDWSWLLALMCPLMMLPMIFIFMKGNKTNQSPLEEQEKKMKMEIEILKDQNKTMQEIIGQVKHKRDIK